MPKFKVRASKEIKLVTVVEAENGYEAMISALSDSDKLNWEVDNAENATEFDTKTCVLGMPYVTEEK